MRFLAKPALWAVLFTIISSGLATASAKKIDEFSALKATLKKYRNTSLITMKVEKTVKSELLGKETRMLGTIALAAGKFRWENNEPEKSLLVFDGKNIWNEQSAPKDFPGPVQVAKAKVDKKNKSQIILSTLLEGKAFFENFKVMHEKKSNDLWIYAFESKTKDLNLKDLEIVVRQSKATKEVQSISYSDDVGNRTEMKFSKIEFKKSNSDKKLFQYSPPKGAQVTNL